MSERHPPIGPASFVLVLAPFSCKCGETTNQMVRAKITDDGRVGQPEPYEATVECKQCAKLRQEEEKKLVKLAKERRLWAMQQEQTKVRK